MLVSLLGALAACKGSSATVDAPAPSDTAGPDALMVACDLPVLTTHVATLSGCSQPGAQDGPRGVALFSNPVNLVLAPSGLAYVADFDSSRLRKVDSDGTVTTVLMRPDFHHPFGLARTQDGYLYVETDDDDQGQHSTTTGTIWKVNPATADAHVIARDIGRPRGIAVLPNGQLALTDQMHHVIELLDPNTGTPTVLAGQMDNPGHAIGTGTAAQFNQPWNLVLFQGDLIVTDFGNNMLRRVTLAGAVSDFTGQTTAGHADGTLANALFSNPKGIALATRTGALYVTEAGNHDVREIASGSVTTVAGTTQPGWHDDNNANSAMFYGVEGLDVTSDGTRVVVADGNDGDGMMFHHVREIH